MSLKQVSGPPTRVELNQKIQSLAHQWEFVALKNTKTPMYRLETSMEQPVHLMVTTAQESKDFYPSSITIFPVKKNKQRGIITVPTATRDALLVLLTLIAKALKYEKFKNPTTSTDGLVVAGDESPGFLGYEICLEDSIENVAFEDLHKYSIKRLELSPLFYIDWEGALTAKLRVKRVIVGGLYEKAPAAQSERIRLE